jgi:TPR repeat protein
MKRVKANDPAAISCMGGRRYQQEDYETAFEYLTKAAELGDANAHLKLGCMYYMGEGVEKDEKRGMYYFEKAAIGGHPQARHHLAIIEGVNGNIEREVKHFVIAANLGEEESMKALWGHFSAGRITKEELESTLRTHKAAIDATKSAQRDTGEAYYGSLRTIKY